MPKAGGVSLFFERGYLRNPLEGGSMTGKMATVLIAAGLFFVPVSMCMAESGKIAVITMQKIVKQSQSGKKATEELQKKFESLQKSLQQKQDALKAFKEDMDKKASLLSEEARAEKEREYKKMLREFKEQSDDAQFEMRQAEAKVMEPILKTLEQVVTKIGESGGYALILENNMPGIYYVSPTIDITDEVIKAYDKEQGR